MYTDLERLTYLQYRLAMAHLGSRCCQELFVRPRWPSFAQAGIGGMLINVSWMPAVIVGVKSRITFTVGTEENDTLASLCEPDDLLG